MNKILLLFLSFCFLFLNVEANELDYDYSDTFSIPIKLKILKEISTKDGLIEGDEIQFKVIKNVYHKRELIVKKDEIVSARIETYITKGFNGFPAEIIVGNFKFENLKSSQLLDTYSKAGANRCFWVFPIKWALTPIPFVGSITNLILGGEAKITTDDIITIYYYPNWK